MEVNMEPQLICIGLNHIIIAFNNHWWCYPFVNKICSYVCIDTNNGNLLTYLIKTKYSNPLKTSNIPDRTQQHQTYHSQHT